MTSDDAAVEVVTMQGRARSLAVPLLFVVVGLVTFVSLLATDTDVTVWQDFRRDVTVRDAYTLDELADIRFFDTSPFTIWLPSDLQVRAAIRSATLPLWDRGQAGGYSPLLNAQNGVMHPARWLMAAVPREATPDALVLLELSLLAIGMFLFLHLALRLSEGAALLGALVLAFSGPTLSVLFFSGAILPLVHAPWLAWAYLRWADTRRRLYSALFVAFAAMLILSGHALMIATALMAVCIVAICDCIARRSARNLAGLAAMLGFAVSLTAFATLPVLIHLRSIWSYKLQSSQGAPYQPLDPAAFWDAMTWIFTHHPLPSDKFDGGSLAYFVGVGVAVLAAIGAVAAARDRRTVAITVLVVIGLLLAVPPPFMTFVRGTPLKFFKPWYLMFVFAFGIASAAAMGFDRTVAAMPRRWRVAAGAALALLSLAPLARPVREVLVPMRLGNARSDVVEFLRADREVARTTGFQGQTNGPNAASITGIEDLRISTPLIPIRFRTWFEIADPVAVATSFPTTITPTSAASPLFGAFNVKYFMLSRDPVLFCHTFLPRPGEKPHRKYFFETPPSPDTHPLVRQERSISVFRNELNYHARAHFARDVRVVTGGINAAAAELRKLGGALGETEILEAKAPIGSATVAAWIAPLSPDETLRMSYPSDRDVLIETTTRSPRLVVLHDSYDPGWRAFIDTREGDLLPVSLISRGVVVPAGHHVIAMRFTPVGMREGMAVSTVFTVVGLFLLFRKKHVIDGALS